MSQDNGMPEAAAEDAPEDMSSIIAMKEVISMLVTDESLTLLERRNALESLRLYLDDVIETLDARD